jgi:ComF family protein
LLSPAFADRPDARCGLCQRAHPPFERAVTYGRYDGGLRDLIHLLKYQEVRPAARVLGSLVGETIKGLESSLPDGAIQVVPVPLHRRKQGERGFNQAELIARIALKQLGRPERFRLCLGVLTRQRETGSQVGLTRHQRRVNLRGAFAVIDPTQIAQRNILLVDDVFTTGATVSECARVLRRSGAARVWAVTVARTLQTAEESAIRDDVWKKEREEQDRAVMAASG